MASSASGETMAEPAAKHEQVEFSNHPFTEPWEDSDLIFVVEGEKFHVHRQIMSIHSPVFKAMLNCVGFKEARATQIPLPGKKADEFLDFLKILYVKKVDEVHFNQVEHLLKLADEYQAGGIIDMCVNMLKSEPKSKDNALKILHLATSTATARDDQRLFEVREQCYELIEDMELTEAQRNDDHRNLEKEIWETVLVKRIQRLETFVREIYPQFVDLVELSLSDRLREKSIFPCPRHFSNGKANEHLLRRMKDCPVCRQMIKQLICNLKKSKQPPRSFQFGASPGSMFGGLVSDEKEMMVILDFEKIIGV
ncbi:kelch-like protein 40 [Acropora millepora]|uniref:kelch-like protein 40 n=1 Tax=Acropora millepora TaxID=45264 RepID=UPI001CF5F6D2|nr:kelch-like protein 40 [Acropora millepora]